MLRGLSQRQEVDPGLLLRDTRTMGQRIHDFFQSPTYVAVILICFAACAFCSSAI